MSLTTRRRLTATIASTCLAAAAFALGAAPAAAQVTVPIATWGGDKHVINTGFLPPLEKALAEQGKGKLKLENYPNGTLATDKDMPVGIPTGKVKIGLLTVGGWSGTVKDVKVL